jgi:hypothetical protein
MSLTGNIYYGGQNLENTHPLDTLTVDIDNLTIDILQNSQDIETNTTNIETNTTNISTNTTNISTNTNNIATNISSIRTIQGVNTTQDTRLSNVELKTRQQSSSFNTTVFNFAVHAVDVFAVNDPTYGNVRILRNHGEIASNLIKINTDTSNISTNTANITAIQGVNTNQDGRLTNIEKKQIN